ncbi:guanylate kinase [Buchnera aphidicola]|uniref:Guanylate kinase n=1 Tax=Buchnera aphidicola (Anoecia oenotherae) TaxID=1241833 RepID=A0A4D6XZK7_9GAMM|nr:guanylate kinase [Buchnera aphidicola]QCI19450.1 guanylate kinase [Buchnera aphidicola (Anoecia oenotherae)]
MTKGTLFIISAPSGTGKSSLIRAFLKKKIINNVEVSVSHTTRSIRPGELDGKDYYFISIKKFKIMVKKNKFIEYAKVFNHYYGTSYTSIINKLISGKDVFLDIDWQGAQQIKKKVINSKSIFLLPPSKKELISRLKKRNQDSNFIISKRMKMVKTEISRFHKYDYIIINDDFNTSLLNIKYIILSQRLSVEYQKKHNVDLIQNLLKK